MNTEYELLIDDSDSEPIGPMMQSLIDLLFDFGLEEEPVLVICSSLSTGKQAARLLMFLNFHLRELETLNPDRITYLAIQESVYITEILH